MSHVAQKIAENHIINAEIIGRALSKVDQDAHLWSEFTSSPNQLLKYLWHVLVRFGTHYT